MSAKAYEISDSPLKIIESKWDVPKQRLQCNHPTTRASTVSEPLSYICSVGGAGLTQKPARATFLDRSRKATTIVVTTMMETKLAMMRPRWSAWRSKPGLSNGA